jgi:nicotinamidase-related amidase
MGIYTLQLTIEERPTPMPVTALNPTATALVLIDLQRGITAMPTQPHPTSEVIANAAKLAAGFRSASAPVITVRVAPSPDGGDALRADVDEPRRPREMPADFAEIVPQIRDERDIVVTKKQWGAFYGTDLDLQLRRRHITTIVLGGISTNMGVESTARAAHEHGYNLVLVEDAMSALDGDDHTFAITRIFPKIGRLASTSEVLAALTSIWVRQQVVIKVAATTQP